ncbi:MAG: CoA transferase [Chloroflexi bacterium]|nr:CoA transferase [Chloroflexota bacterium]
MTALPLHGLRVVELGRTCMAAYCARLLADAGADVVKVEPPVGDPSRRRGPFPNDTPHPERSGLFLLVNVNKRGVCLDVEQQEGLRAFHGLLKWAQVLVTDLPRPEARRLGLAWRVLHRSYPHLLVTSVTYFGGSGPYRDYHANDHVVYNMGGLAYATPGIPDHVDDPGREPPLRPSTPISEFIAGAAGATATLLALLATRRDRQGRYIEVSAQEAVASLLFRDIVAYSYLRLVTGRRPVQVAVQPNALMPCKDGYILLAVPYDHMWQRFVGLLGDPEWAQWDLFKDSLHRAANWDALYPLLLDWTMRFTGEEIMHMTQGIGIPCFRSFRVAEVVESAHERERGYFWELPVEGNRDAKVPGSPFIMSGTPFQLRRSPPRLGQHNHEVLG